MWGSKKDHGSPAAPSSDALETQSARPSEATTLAPPVNYHVQPTCFDTSPEAVARAQSNAKNASEFDTSYMSEEEKAKLRAQGINPALKAEMDAKVYGKKQGKGSGWKGIWRVFCLGNSWG